MEDINKVTREQLQDGRVLSQLKHRFLNQPGEELFYALLNCLRDSQVVVPVLVNGEPDLMRSDDKQDEIFFPMFSSMRELPAEYSQGVDTVTMSVLDCVEKAKAYGTVKGIVLDPLTASFTLEFPMAEVIAHLESKLAD